MFDWASDLTLCLGRLAGRETKGPKMWFNQITVEGYALLLS